MRYPQLFSEHLNDGQVNLGKFCYYSKLFLNPFISMNQPTLREHALIKSTLVQIYDLNNSVCSQIFMGRNTCGVINFHIFRADRVSSSNE